jgi:uncharacterized protein YbaR (Trm112 family)
VSALACPKCRSTALETVETATIHYGVTINAAGDNVNYTGERTVMDDAEWDWHSVWCPSCSLELTVTDLVPA